MSDDPIDQAGREFAQMAMIAVQILEMGVRMAADFQARREAQAREAAAQLRAARQEAYSLDRVRFSRAFDGQWLREAGGRDLGEAWGAGARWADSSVQADAATRRLETRMRQVWPEQMTHYDALREAGWDRLSAMSTAAERARQTAAAAAAAQAATVPAAEPATVGAGLAAVAEDPRLREARRAFSPAQDEAWVAAAGAGDLDRAWRAAAVWADLDPGAEVAATRIEDRMRQQRPDIMATFDELRGSGTNRMEALWEATRSTTPTTTAEATTWDDVPVPGDVDAAAAWESEAAVREHQAADAAARRDDPRTVDVDEHLDGLSVAIGAQHAAADLHRQAAAASYPTSVATVVATAAADQQDRTDTVTQRTQGRPALPAVTVRPALTGQPSTTPRR